VNAQRAAEVQAVLEGIPLPATRAELIAYAREQDGDLVRDLEELPDQEYDRIDAVGELLTMQPSAPKPPEHGLPRPESGKPPGGDDYLRAFPSDTGKVRHDAPRTNPPQKAIEKASKTQKKQKAEQGG
jgi:hypothetical protein